MHCGKEPSHTWKYMPHGNRSSGGPTSYALTTAEREYLKDGTTGGYRESRLESRIEEKAEALPSRFDRLLEDVELLKESGQLDEEIGEATWQEMLTTALKPPQEFSAAEMTEVRPGFLPTTSLTAFARRFGNLMHHLLRNPETTEYSVIIKQLIFGFMQGLYIEQLTVKSIEEKGIDGIVTSMCNDISELAKEVEEKRESFFGKGFGDALDERRRADTALNRHVRQTLYDAGILEEQPNSLKAEIEESGIDQTEKSSEEVEIIQSEEDLQETMWDQSLIRRTVGHLRAEKVDSDSIPGTGGAWTDFWSQHNATTFNPEESFPPTKIIEIFEQKRILGRILLEKRIRSDVDDLEEQSWRGVEAVGVVRSIHQHGPSSSSAINEILDSRKDHTAQITRLARDLSGEDHKTRETWEELSLIKGDKTEWELSPYGQVLATYAFDYNHLFIDVLEDKLVDRGIDVLLDAGLIEYPRGV